MSGGMYELNETKSNHCAVFTLCIDAEKMRACVYQFTALRREFASDTLLPILRQTSVTFTEPHPMMRCVSPVSRVLYAYAVGPGGGVFTVSLAVTMVVTLRSRTALRQRSPPSTTPQTGHHSAPSAPPTRPLTPKRTGYAGGRGVSIGSAARRRSSCCTASSSCASSPPCVAAGRLSTCTSGTTP